RIGEKSPYIITDIGTPRKFPGRTFQALSSFPVVSPNGNLKIMTTKSGRQNFNSSFEFKFHPVGVPGTVPDGFDLAEIINYQGARYATFSRTYDGGCYDQLWTLDGQIANRGGWMLF